MFYYPNNNFFISLATAKAVISEFASNFFASWITGGEDIAQNERVVLSANFVTDG